MTEIKKEKKEAKAPVVEPRTFEIRTGEGPGYIGRHKLVPDVGTGHSKPVAATRVQVASLIGCRGMEARAIGADGKVLVKWTEIKDRKAIAMVVGGKS